MSPVADFCLLTLRDAADEDEDEADIADGIAADAAESDLANFNTVLD